MKLNEQKKNTCSVESWVVTFGGGGVLLIELGGLQKVDGVKMKAKKVRRDDVERETEEEEKSCATKWTTNDLFLSKKEKRKKKKNTAYPLRPRGGGDFWD